MAGKLHLARVCLSEVFRSGCKSHVWSDSLGQCFHWPVGGSLGSHHKQLLKTWPVCQLSLWFSEAAAQASFCAQPFRTKPPADLLAYTLNPEKPLSFSSDSSACLLRTLPAGESVAN